jgi:hypothetical protein
MDEWRRLKPVLGEEGGNLLAWLKLCPFKTATRKAYRPGNHDSGIMTQEL